MEICKIICRNLGPVLIKEEKSKGWDKYQSDLPYLQVLCRSNFKKALVIMGLNLNFNYLIIQLYTESPQQKRKLPLMSDQS